MWKVSIHSWNSHIPLLVFLYDTNSVITNLDEAVEKSVGPRKKRKVSKIFFYSCTIAFINTRILQ